MLLAPTHGTQRNNMREGPWVAAKWGHFFGGEAPYDKQTGGFNESIVP